MEASTSPLGAQLWLTAKQTVLCLFALLLLSCGGDATPAAAPQPAEIPSGTALVAIEPTSAERSIIESTPEPGATPTLNSGAQATATLIAQITPSSTPTPSPTPSPTPTPSINIRVELAERAMHNGDFTAAIDHYAIILAESADATNTQRDQTRQALAMAHYADGNIEATRLLLEDLVDRNSDNADAWFVLGRIHQNAGNCPAAVEAFRRALPNALELESIVRPWIGQCLLTMNERPEAIRQFELAASADAHFLNKYQNRLTLAQLYGGDNRHVDANALFTLIRTEARTDYTRAEIGYLQADTLMATGDKEGGYDLYRQLVDEHPTQRAAYLSLVELVTNNRPVDQYQRGIVDYYAEAYVPCVDALETYLEENATEFKADAMIFLAWCYEGIGNSDAAFATLNEWIELSTTHEARGLFEKANLARRLGSSEQAQTLYEQLLAEHPDAEQTPIGLWWLARLRDWGGKTDEAIAAYVQVADDYPEYDRAAEGLFRAGWLARPTDEDLTRQLWYRSAETYPDTYHGASALTWLLQIDLVNPDAMALAQTFEPQERYYSARVVDIAAERAPFTPAEALNFELDQAEAEAWLREKLGVSAGGDLGRLPSVLANDPHIQRGERLWNLREFELAKREFEYMRQEAATNVLSSYQLSLYFRDVGLYRTSILAGQAVINQLGETPFSVPKFIGSLAYPAYYQDLVLPLAEDYGYDPLLQFALVRQESLYESFATSIAVAQGLAQVIPDTGTYIADKLAWPEYQNSDLYKPYVGLTFGGFYLDEQLEFFDGYSHAALAAYNGGPGNAQRWFNVGGGNIDAYVETVNFRETRAYIERIYFGHAIYRHIYSAEGNTE